LSIIIGVVVGAIILAIIVLVAVFAIRRQKKSDSTSDDIPLEAPYGESISSLNTWKTLDNITIGKRLGEGNFGDVFKGNWHGTDVALKLLKSEEQFADFEREASLLQYAFQLEKY
jgi:serine/threonine protein kinase